MRKCPYCAMVSEDAEACTWCRRPFDNGFYARAGIKPEPKKALLPPRVSQAGKGVGLTLVIGLAIFVLAHQKWAPDAASVAQISTHGTTAGATQGPVQTPAVVAANTPTSAVQAPSHSNNNAISPASGATASTSGNRGDAPTAEPVQGMAKLAQIRITTANDGTDHETALGSVLIVNLSPYEISDFRLGLQINGSITPLVPFQGNINYPTDNQARRIPAHGRLQVAVMTPNHYLSAPTSARSVVLEATFDGQHGMASDSAPLR